MKRSIPFLCFSSLMMLVGCQQKTKETPPTAPLKISVSHPVQRTVTDFVDFTGQTQAKESVNVRARVTGYMQRLVKPYKEGAEVEMDEVLFKIDPSLYQPVVDQAHAQLEGAKAALVFAEKQLAIDKPLSENDFVGKLKVAQDQAAVDSAKATILGAEARLKAAQQNLDFTTVKAPIGGRISRYFLTPGNLVTADQTNLTTIVSMNPMYAYFEVDVPTRDRYMKAINAGKKKTPKAKTKEDDKAPKADDADPPQFPVQMALEGEGNFNNWRGNIDFINNQVNQSTSTITVRGVFQNERLLDGDWQILPGSFVRIRLPIGEAHPALLVIDRAIGSDQKRKFVYVVDADKKVQSRSVITGALQNGLRVIDPYDPETKTGLKPDDWVVVGGLPQLQPGMTIQPDEIDMPTLANTDAATSRDRPQQPSGKLPKKQ